MNRTPLIIAACLSATSILSVAVYAQPSTAFLQGRVYELRGNATPPTCFEWPSGLPDGVWGTAGEYGPETAKWSGNGDALVVSAIYKPTGETVSYRFFKSRQTCQQALANKPEAITPAATKTESHGDDLTYVERLQRDFGARLQFSSPKAEALLKKVNLDCKSQDGRYLPLYNALLARLHEASEPEAWMETRVINTGNNIAIYDSVHLKDGKRFDSQLAMEVNEWGGITAHGVRPNALANACFGSYGPIWKF